MYRRFWGWPLLLGTLSYYVVFLGAFIDNRLSSTTLRHDLGAYTAVALLLPFLWMAFKAQHDRVIALEQQLETLRQQRVTHAN